jgi:NAD(P)H dehydrogenase (quinone)
MDSTNNTILVTGASGQLGQRVIHHLLESNNIPPARIIATTRNPERLGDLTVRGVTVRYADFNDTASLHTAFAGAEKILIISTDLLDLVGGQRLKQHEAAIAAARRVGAEHLAYTSMLKPEPGSPFLLANDHYGTDQALKASGLGYTIFRPNAYHENLLLSLPGVLAGGRWLTSAGLGRVAYAARDDMAAAIAGRLASDARDSQTFGLTGPAAYSTAEVASMCAAITGRPIEVVDVSDDALCSVLLANGIAEPMARLLVSAEANVRAGNSESVTNTVEALSRRKPMTLRRFLEANLPELAHVSTFAS